MAWRGGGGRGGRGGSEGWGWGGEGGFFCPSGSPPLGTLGRHTKERAQPREELSVSKSIKVLQKNLNIVNTVLSGTWTRLACMSRLARLANRPRAPPPMF